MQVLKNLLILLLGLAALLLGAMFAVQNEARVPLDLLIFSLPERSVALWVLVAFALGGLLGMATSVGVLLRLRASLRAAHRKLGKQSAKQAAEQPAASAPAEPEA